MKNISLNPLFLMSVLCILVTSTCFADQIVIFGNHNKWPKTYMDGKTPKGILIDIMSYIDQEMDHSFNYQLYPWKRAYINSLSGKGGIIGLSMNSERLKLFDYSHVMYYDELLLVVLKENAFFFKSIQDLTGKQIGVLRGASYGQEFELGKHNTFEIDEDTNPEQRLLKLLHGRIDAAIIGPGKTAFNRVIQSSEILAKKKEAFVILKEPFYKDPNYLGFPKTMQMARFLSDFNQALKKGYATGVIPDIIQSNE